MSVRAAVERATLSPDEVSSRIALFLIPGTSDTVDAVFDATVVTQNRIKACDPLYVGSFSAADSGTEILKMVEAARNKL